MRALLRDWLCYQNDSMSPVAHPASVEGPLEAFLALALVLLRGLARRADLVEQDARHRRERGAVEPPLGLQSPERRKAFGQWKKHSSTSTPTAIRGRLSWARIDSRISASRTIEARPFTRSVSSRPGIRKIVPTCAFWRRFFMPSSRLLPGRSGITRWRSSRTRTKPGASPLGETSHRPLALAVASRRNGDRAMKARQCSSRTATSFLIARWLGEPSSSRSSLSVVTMCLNMRPPVSSASRDEAVLAVRSARRARPFRRRPVPAAARRLHQEHVAGPHADPDLFGLEDAERTAAREESVAMREPLGAAEEAVGRVTHAVARRVRDRGLRDVHPKSEHRAHAAAVHAVPAGVGAELVVLEREREPRLRDFHAPELDPARRLPFARGLPAVADGGRAAAGARVEHVPDERASRAWVHALDRDAEPPAPARDGARRARGRERSDDRLGDVLGAVVGREGHGRRRIGPDDRALPGHHLHGAEGGGPAGHDRLAITAGAR